MSSAQIDQVAAVKASLELMVAENAEIHEYFTDLLEKVAELEDEDPETRREKFKDLQDLGAFRFNGLDIRHFTQTHHRPLPPPVFLARTMRRMRNTLTLVDEFAKRGIFEEATLLRDELAELSDNVIDGTDTRAVQAFKAQVDALRGSTRFHAYLESKSSFITKDAELRAEAEFLAAKESVEEGEELFRLRGDELDSLGSDIEAGSMALDEAQQRLDAMSLDAQGGAAETSAATVLAKPAEKPDGSEIP